MSQSDKHWYQDGGNVLLILMIGGSVLFIGFCFVAKHVEESRPVPITNASGRLELSLLTQPTLHVSVWHQFPGKLRNGALTVRTDSPMVVKSDQIEMYSFEEWEPNRDAQVELTFQLRDFDSLKESPLTVQLVGKNSRPYQYTYVWLGNDWKPNQVE